MHMNNLSRFAVLLAVCGLVSCGKGSPSPTSPSAPSAPSATSAAVVVVKDVAATVESTATGVIYRTVLTVSETGGRSGATIASIRVNLSNSTRSGSSTFTASEIKTTLTAGGSNLYLLNVTSDNTDRYTSVTFTVTFADTAGVPGAYTSPASIGAITPVVASNPSPTPPTTPAPSSGKYDGTYDMFFRFPTSGSTSSSATLSRFMFIRNGVVTSADGLSAGTVDSFGAIRFTAPCTINSSGAVWTGIMNASSLSGSNFGQGEYACNDRITGPQTWQATQSR